MSTMKCPDCGRKVSTRTTFTRCPYCGCPMTEIKKSEKIRRLKSTIGWSIAIITLVMIGMCNDKSDEKSSKGDSVKQTPQTEKVSADNSSKSEKYEKKNGNKVETYNEEVQDIITVEEPIEEVDVLETTAEEVPNEEIREISSLIGE